MRSILSALYLGAACFLATGCSGSGGAQNEPAHLDNIPTFPTTSAEPVLLRYKLKTGQTLKIVVDIDMDLAVHMNGQDLKMKQAMAMEATGTVKSVDAQGNMLTDVKITHMKMKVSGGQMNMELDSARPNDGNPNLKPLLAMLNVNIPCKISPVGKMLETDLEPLRLALSRSGNAAFGKALQGSAGKMFEGTFVQLSETPVKAGDTYTAGTIVAEDKIKMHMSYKIASVSGDKKQAVLEPIVNMELVSGAFPGGQATIQSQRIAGWVLFDVEKGYPSKGEIRMHVVMDVSASGQKGTVDMTGKTLVTANVE